MIPKKIIVRLERNDLKGAAVLLKFEMNYKNPYSYIVFLDQDGRGEVEREELLRHFHEQLKIALMDFGSADVGYTGKLDAKIMTKDQILKAIKGYDRYR